MTANVITITVFRLDGDLVLKADNLAPTDSVRSLRLQVDNALGFRFSKLIFSGVELEDDSILEDAGFKGDAVVQVAVSQIINIEHAEAETRAELIYINGLYSPQLGLLVDGAIQWHIYLGTTTQAFWFSRKADRGIEEEAQRRFSNGEGVMEASFLHQLGSVLKPGDYEVGKLLVRPRIIAKASEEDQGLFRAPSRSEFDPSDPSKWVPLWDSLCSSRFSDDYHYRCEFAAAAEEELLPVTENVYGEKVSRLLVMHTIAPLQTMQSLDGERLAEYEAKLKAGVRCTAWAVSSAFLDDYDSCNGNPWLRTGLMSFLLDGHHKVCAAARTGLPLQLLVFQPRSLRRVEPGPSGIPVDFTSGNSPEPLKNLDTLDRPVLTALASLGPETQSSFDPPSLRSRKGKLSE